MTAFTLKTYLRSPWPRSRCFLRQGNTMGLEAAWVHAMAREGAVQAANKAGVTYRSDELGHMVAQIRAAVK